MRKRVTARSRRRPDGEVQTVYRVDGRTVTDAERVAAVLDAE
jgi:hypothetical protein